MNATLTPSHLDAFAAMAWTWAVAFLPRLVTAVIILAAGGFLAGWVGRIVFGKIAEAGRIDETTRPVLASVVRYAIWILAIVAALSQIGVQMASLLAVLGAAGLAIGLALQGTLANIASGLMLLWLRPFRIGDYVEVMNGNGVSGRVKEIGLFACQLETYDGIFVFAPNSTIWNFALHNHSRNSGRLVSFTVSLPNDADVEQAREILLQMARDDRRLLKVPSPEVFLDNVTDSGALLTCRFWAAYGMIGDVQRTMLEEAKRRLEAHGKDWQPRHITRTVPPDSDPSRLMPPPRIVRQAAE
jgi:small conductance mechanosensitive channel